MKKTKERFIKRFAQLAWPISLQTTLASCFIFIDMMMVQQLGDNAVGAMGIIGRFYFLITLTFAGMSSGAAILLNQFVATKKVQQAGSCFVMLLASVLLIAVPLFIWVMSHPQYLLSTILEHPPTLALAQTYLVTSAPVILLFGFISAFATLSRAFKNTRLPLVASLFAILINTGLNYVLIFGHFGMPKLGLEGAAIATLVAISIEVVLLAVLLCRTKIISLTLLSGWRIITSHSNQFYKLSLPFLFQELSWAGGMFGYSLIFAKMGPNVLAATSFMLPIEGLFISVFVGGAVACSVLIGHQLGLRKYKQAQVTAVFLTRTTTVIACVVGLFIPALIWGLESQISLSEDVKTVTLTIALALVFIIPLRVFAMMLIVGVLRAGGDSKGVIVIDGVTLWGLGLPIVATCAFVLGWSISAVFIVLVIEEAIKAGWLWLRVNKGMWKNNFVGHEAC